MAGRQMEPDGARAGRRLRGYRRAGGRSQRGGGGGDPRASAASLVQARANRLRRILDPGGAEGAAGGLLASAGTGYRLNVTAGQLDLLEFRDLAGRGGAAARAGQAAVACGLY